MIRLKPLVSFDPHRRTFLFYRKIHIVFRDMSELFHLAKLPSVFEYRGLVINQIVFFVYYSKNPLIYGFGFSDIGSNSVYFGVYLF